MNIGGLDIIEAKWTFSEENLSQVAQAVIMDGRIGGNFGITTPNLTLEGTVEVKIPKNAWTDGLQEAVIWAAKQRIGAQNYWLLNRWGRWEEYGYEDVAVDWAMNKAIRLTTKVGKKAVKKTRRAIKIIRAPAAGESPPPRAARRPWRPATIGAGAAGTTFLLAGFLLPAFLGGADTWGLNPNNTPPTVN